MNFPFFSYDFTRKRRYPAGFLAAALVFPCLFAAGCDGSPKDFDTYTQQLFCSSVSANTLNLHYTLAFPEAYGITSSQITLGSLSEDALANSRAKTENTLAALKRFDYRSLPKEQQLTYDVLLDSLSTEQSVADLLYYDEPLRPSTGISSQLPILFEEYRFYDKQDVEDYLALIACTDEYFLQIADFEARKAEYGLFMSDELCRQLISQCETFVQNPENHYLIETFEKKVAAVEGLSDSERLRYCSENASIVTHEVLPAYEQLADSLEALLGSGKNDGGLCYLPKGNRFYQYLVYYNTGCADQIPVLFARIQKQRQEDLMQASALTQTNPTLRTECQNITLDGMDASTALSMLRQEMLQAFPAPPDTNYTVSPIDECMADFMAPAFYITAPLDNYSENSIFINAETDSSSMQFFTTLAHEGFPGHLYQTVMSYDAGLPPVRAILNYPGYVEGWATYVEMLSYHYAGLPEPAAEFLARNQSAILSLYASTDIGIHYSGWSFEEMCAFWSSYGITDKNTLREIYQLIVAEPAHYLKYYVGYLQFLDLKKTARETYGDAYSDVSFHRAVLAIGPAPFSIVEKYLDHYYRPEQNARRASWDSPASSGIPFAYGLSSSA